MKATLVFAAIGMLIAAGGVRAHDHGRAHERAVSNRGMQAVPTSAGPGEPGHGWRYFTDPAVHRAVVISPQGEYYYSRGKGPVLVAVTQPAS